MDDVDRVLLEERPEALPAGQNLAAKFQSVAPGVIEWKPAKPLTVAKGKLTVSVKDKQGNATRIARTFSATK